MSTDTIKTRLVQLLAKMIKRLIPPGKEPHTTLRVMLYLSVLIAITLVLVGRIDHLDATMFVWYLSEPKSLDRTALLSAESGMAITAWTGALIAFQLRGDSFRISGAFLLLSMATIAPLLSLLTDGPVLRTFALIAALFFCARALVHIVMSVLLRWALRRYPDLIKPGPAAPPIPIADLLMRFAQGLSLPATYAAVAALAALAILLVPTSTVVAWATLAIIASSLRLVLETLKQPVPTKESREKTGEQIDGVITSLKNVGSDLMADGGASHP